MKRIQKIGLIVALLALVFGVCLVAASAEEGPTVAFTVTTPEGRSTDYYDETLLSEIASAAPSGSTVVIQSDIGTYGNISVSGGKTLYIDLNGKTLINKNHTSDDVTTEGRQENKTCFAVVNSAELHVYSSQPGAAYFARNQTNQNPFINTNGTGIAYIGGYPTADGETVYSGDNISAFGCTAFNATGTSVVHVDGGYYYRNHTDYSGLLIARAGSTINLKNVKLYANNGSDSLIFSFQEGDTTSTASSFINCDGCIVVGSALAGTIIPPAHMWRPGCVLTLKDTVVCEGNIAVDTGSGTIVIEDGCSFDTISDEDIKAGKIRFADGSSYAKTNGSVTVEWYMNDYYNNTSAPFSRFDRTETYSPTYAFAKEEDIATVTWRLGGVEEELIDEETGEPYTVWAGGRVMTDRWIIGTTPRFTEELNPYGSYTYGFSEEIGAVTGDTEFVATELVGSPDVTLKAKLRLHAGLDFCIYFPVSLTNTKLNLYYHDVTFPDGSSRKLASRSKETVDGVEYYVLEVSGLGVADVLSDIDLTFGVTLRVINEYAFTNTLSFSVLDYAENLLAVEGTEADKEKALLLHYLAFVSAAAPEGASEEALAKLSDILRSEEAISILSAAAILDLDRQIPEVTASTAELFPSGAGISSVHLDAIGGKGLVIRLADSFSGTVTISYKNGGSDVNTLPVIFTDGKNAKGEDSVILSGTRAGKITITLTGADKTQKAKFVFTLNDYIADVGENPVSKAYCDYLGFLYVIKK